MTTNSTYPSLFQLNTRARLHERGEALGRAATLDDLDDAELDRLAEDGFDWVWLLGVWQTGDAGRAVSLREPTWQAEYRHVLGDVWPDDVSGSPFAVRDYTVHREFGGPPALTRLRRRLAKRGVRLMLDFVPNHTALDHPWAGEHPEYYVAGTPEDLAREPQNWTRVDTRGGAQVLAHGRDPYFPGWPDTLQLNYRHPALREAMAKVLERLAEQCDGVRCDMAMLVLPEVIQWTWGARAEPADGPAPVDAPFWPWAIERVRRHRPDFVFMAEAYWDLEWTLQQQGFDYTYDKRLYDRLRAHDAGAVVAHLQADADYQRRSARFLENHDEPRAAAVFPTPAHQAAAVITLLTPGLRLVHEGQTTGRRLRTSNHLRRRAVEPIDRELETFYGRLLAAMRRPEVRGGQWRLAERAPAWDGNRTWEQLVAFSWTQDGRRLLVAVNCGPRPAQGYVRGFPELGAGAWTLHDLVNPTIRFERNGSDLAGRGLYLDVPGWRAHVFDVAPADVASRAAA
jgi:glycosidase